MKLIVNYVYVDICPVRFLSEWSKTRCFIAIALRLCFRICHWEGPGKPSGTEIKWNTSAAGLCWLYESTGG
jgi:hypothetical protein